MNRFSALLLSSVETDVCLLNQIGDERPFNAERYKKLYRWVYAERTLLEARLP